MSAVETGQVSAAETGQMSAVETRQMYSIKTGQRPVAIVDICLVSTADICPVSTADISISIDHSASAFRINNQHIMEAATAADLTQASEIAGRYITLGRAAKGYGPGQGLPASPWPGPGGPSPAQNVGSGPNHQTWPELGPESTVRPENRSRT